MLQLCFFNLLKLRKFHLKGIFHSQRLDGWMDRYICYCYIVIHYNIFEPSSHVILRVSLNCNQNATLWNVLQTSCLVQWNVSVHKTNNSNSITFHLNRTVTSWSLFVFIFSTLTQANEKIITENHLSILPRLNVLLASCIYLSHITVMGNNVYLLRDTLGHNENNTALFTDWNRACVALCEVCTRGLDNRTQQ